jgi:hypothetical protein
MAEPVHLAIDIAMFPPERKDATERQRRCVQCWLTTAPNHWRILLGETPGARKIPNGLLQWPRSGYKIASDKHVPFVRDLLDAVTSIAQEPDTLCGFVNSDIYPMPKLFADVDRLNDEGADYVLVHRTDIPKKQFDAALKGYGKEEASALLGKRANKTFCADGVFMTPRVWAHVIKPIFPDFVIGEPWWDATLIEELTSRGELKQGHLSNDVALHAMHSGGWHAQSAYAERAHNLYKDAWNRRNAQ